MRSFEDYCWSDILTDDMTRIYSAYHRQRAISSRPALVVVHPENGFTAVAQPEWPKEVERIAAIARKNGTPVVHSRRNTDDRLHVRIAPEDFTCARPCESAFFFSDLERVLTRQKVNGVIVVGAPASGAVRATAAEAKSYGYRTAIAEDATGDESSLLRKVALFDVAHKYADVMSADEVIEFLQAGKGTAS